MSFLKKLKVYADFPTVLFFVTFVVCVVILAVFPLHKDKDCKDKKIDLSLPEKEKNDNSEPNCLKSCSPLLWKRYYGIFSACSTENQKKLGDKSIKKGIDVAILDFQKEHGIEEDGLFGKETQKKCK